jgi:putative flippase GtrA
MIQFLKFILVGTLNTALGYAVILGCMYLLGISAVLSNLTGYLFGLTISYVLNRNFTFKSTSKSKTELLRFLIVFLLSYLANLVVLLASIHYAGMHEMIAQVLAGMVYVVTSFLMNKYYVFSRLVLEQSAK